MDIFLGKHNCKVSTKITSRAKDAIAKICEVKEISESQFFRLALQNQIKADEQLEHSKTPQS